MAQMPSPHTFSFVSFISFSFVKLLLFLHTLFLGSFGKSSRTSCQLESRHDAYSLQYRAQQDGHHDHRSNIFDEHLKHPFSAEF